MTGVNPALIGSTARHLNTLGPLVTFPTTGGGSWKVWDRFLAIRGNPAFEIGNICGTCKFMFRRLDAAATPIDLDELQLRLTHGLNSLDEDVIVAFANLLESGTYRIGLFRHVPERVQPGSSRDYFVHEQRAAWPEFGEEELNDPKSIYYRVVGRSDAKTPEEGDVGFEFLVPLQAEDTLDAARIDFFEEELKRGSAPTVVAVGVLDIKQYYESAIAHWCLSHYLLDGHHKLAAAARAGLPITLLSFIATDHGISSPESVDQLLASYPGG